MNYTRDGVNVDLSVLDSPRSPWKLVEKKEQIDNS